MWKRKGSCTLFLNVFHESLNPKGSQYIIIDILLYRNLAIVQKLWSKTILGNV